MKLSLPFAGRKKEVSLLHQFHGERKHVLIIGPEGIGKTALVAHLSERLPLAVCERSQAMGEICRHLETELNSPTPHLSLIQRKNRLLKILTETGRTVVFDGVSWTTPRVSSFLESSMERAPVWICARSELAREIGHFWPLLARFETVQLRPLNFPDTRALLATAVESGSVPPVVEKYARQLHQLSDGKPLRLRELLEQFVTGHYDLSRQAGRRLLELDRRVKHLSLSSA